MTRDKNKFVTLKKEKERSVMFGNDNSTKIIGKDIVSLRKKYAVEKYVLLVENMKHNFLSARQMCDHRHTLIFN
jgi:hypothetical protein